MEIVFMIALGILLLGPKRLPVMLGHAARAKRQLEGAARSLTSQVQAELRPSERKQS